MGNGTENDDPVPAHLRAPNEVELRKRFFYHPPRDEDAKHRHANISQLCFEMSKQLIDNCYPGRQLSLALTALEEVRMRANASIACDDPRP